jgi:hypothetical protein
MAKLSSIGEEYMEKLSNLEIGMRRVGLLRIAKAGGTKCGELMRGYIQDSHHVKSGDMLNSVGMTNAEETFGGVSINIYPMGTDSRGVKNAMKAFVVNHGIGGNPTRKGKRNKTGDKFITGNERHTDGVVTEAMKAEASAFFNEVTGG